MDSTFAEDGGKFDVAGEETAGVAPTGGAGGNIDRVVSGGSGVTIKPFVPIERGVSSDATSGAN